MLNSNGTFSVVRKQPIVNELGIKTGNNCEWLKVSHINCGMLYGQSRDITINENIGSSTPFISSTILKYLAFDMKDQDMDELDIEETDYILYYAKNLTDYFLYEIIGKDQHEVLGCCSYKLTLRNIKPRDCGFSLLSCNNLNSFRKI